MVVEVVLLIVLIGAEWLISSIIATKLRSALNENVGAQLSMGPLLYLPPFGAVVFNPQVSRGGRILFQASRIKVDLAGLPTGDKPVVIASLRLVAPQLYLSPGVFSHPQAQPSTSAPSGPSRKLSDILRLRTIRLSDGKIQWHDPARGNVLPMEWEGLSLDMDTTQESVSRYSFHLITRAQSTADASASGSLDVDSLQLQLKSLVVKVRAEPEPTRSPLPQVVQQWLKTYQVNGDLSISGSGALSLNDPSHAAFASSISLDEADARIPQAQFSIDRAKAALMVSKKPDGPMVVQLQSIEVASASREVTVSSGQITVDAVAGRWALTDLQGRLRMDKPPMDRAASSQPAPSELDKLQLTGQADFTAVASAPFHLSGNPWDAISHQIAVYPRGVSLLLPDFAQRIENIGGGEIRIKGGTIIVQELSSQYGMDAIRLRSARIPLDRMPQLVKIQEISGSVAFQQPSPHYIPVMDKILAMAHPNGLVLIAGSYSMDNTTPACNSTYDFTISTDNCAFAVTSKQIPLEHVRGDVSFTPAGVEVQGIEAQVFGGQVTTTGEWNRTSDAAGSFDGDFNVKNLDLTVARQMFERTSKASIQGNLFAAATFSGTTDSNRPVAEWANALRARGGVEIYNGDFFKLPILQDITSRIRGLKQASTAGSAAMVFDIADSVVTLRNFGISAPILGLQGGGKVGFNGQVDMNVIAAPLADWRDKLRETKIPLISNVAGSIAGGIQKLVNTATGVFLYQFRVSGNLHDKVKVDAIPAPVLTDASAAVLGRMISATKDSRPLDWFRQDQGTTQGQQ